MNQLSEKFSSTGDIYENRAKGTPASHFSQAAAHGVVSQIFPQSWTQYPAFAIKSPMISFKGAHFPKTIILYAVFFYIRYGVSYCDLEEVIEERGVKIDYATLH